MPPHPKPTARAKKPGEMKTKPKAQAAAEQAAVAPASAKKPSTPRKPAIKVGDKVTGAIKGTVLAVSNGQTKGAMILAMLKTPGGATSKEMEAATGWQPHSVRGYLGTLRAEGVKVISKKLPKEPTIYRIEDTAPEAAGEVL